MFHFGVIFEHPPEAQRVISGSEEQVLLEVAADVLQEGPVGVVHLHPVPDAVGVVLNLRKNNRSLV